MSPVDGTVFVASVGGDELTIHDPETGELLDPEDGVNAPDDLFITEDGTMYWTEILNGHVGMMTPDGEVKRQYVGEGVNPITMSDDGRLFTNRLFLGAGFTNSTRISKPIPSCSWWPSRRSSRSQRSTSPPARCRSRSRASTIPIESPRAFPVRHGGLDRRWQCRNDLRL